MSIILEGVQENAIESQNTFDMKNKLKKTSKGLIARNTNIAKNSADVIINKADIILNNTNKNILNVTKKTGVCTLTIANQGVVFVTAAAGYTITLPTAVGNAGLVYRFIKTDNNYNLITLDGNGAETFNYPNDSGVATVNYARLNTYGAEVTIVSDNVGWQCINEKIGQIPKCRVYLGTDQLNIPDSTWTKVNFDTETFDIGGNFDAVTNHVFTVPIDGLYSIESMIRWVNGTADSRIMIRISKNAVALTVKEERLNSLTYQSMAISDKRKFVKTDTIQIQVLQTTGAATIDIYGSITTTFLNIRLLEKS